MNSGSYMRYDPNYISTYEQIKIISKWKSGACLVKTAALSPNRLRAWQIAHITLNYLEVGLVIHVYICFISQETR